jgi:hypothetical protein
MTTRLVSSICWCRRKRCDHALRIAAAAVLVAAGASMSAQGQAPEIEPREQAATAPAWGTPVWETHIAAGMSNVIAVFNRGIRASTCRVSYAVCNRTQGTWGPRQTIAGDHNAIDPSIAFDNPLRSIPLDLPAPPEDKFVAAGLDGVADRILVSRYPDPNNPTGGFEVWRPVVDWPGDYRVDKPWIVAGEVISLLREYYIVYCHRPPAPEPGQDPAPWGYGYLRSTDGGASWNPDPNNPDEAHEIWVGDERVTGGFAAQPAAAGYDGGPLYIAFPTEGVYRFLRGDDRVEDGGVDFSYLPGESGRLEVPRNRRDFMGAIPRTDPPPPHYSWRGPRWAVPQLAVDPKDPNSLYVAYHDAESGDPNDPLYNDVNVYLSKLSWSGQYWEVAQTVQVNDDATFYESDQFLPALTLTPQPGGQPSYVHVIFYDDRYYTDPREGDPDRDQQPDNCACPKFDVFYAWSDVDLLDFEEQNELLYEIDPDDPNDPPALDFGDPNDPNDLWGQFEPGEYIGISAYGDQVWTSFTGTYPPDPPDPKLEALIWSSRIDW